MKLVLEPHGWPCTLADCPPGPFAAINDGKQPWIGFKTDYGKMVPAGDQVWAVGNGPDAYCLDTGEAWWGGYETAEERDAMMVQPLVIVWEEDDD